jgi:MFS family permease
MTSDTKSAADQNPKIGPFESFKTWNYTYFWIASLLSITSFFMLMIARGWLVFDMTGSVSMVGYVSAIAQTPSLVLSVFGGVIADRFNRKTILLLNEGINFIILLILAILVATDVVEVWHLMVLGLINGITFSLAFPSRAAIVPSLVPPRNIANAVALSSIMFSGAQLIGPPIAGWLILVSPATAFFAASGFVGVGIPLFMLLKVRENSGGYSAANASVLDNVREGVKFIRSHRLILGLMSLGFFVVVFGLAYQTFLPVFAEDILKVGPSGLGYLAGAGGIGAIAGSLLIAAYNTVNQMKVFTVVGALGLGVFITGFSLSESFALSMVLSLLAGLFFQLVMTGNFSLIQVLVPDQLRGRVLSVRFIVFGMTPGGILAVGVAAEQIGTAYATAATGVICLAGVILCLLIFPSLYRKQENIIQ